MSIKSDKISKDGYVPFLEEIKSKIKSARIQAYRKVNKELITLYMDIGKKIVEKQKQFGWGKSIVEKLSGDLKKEFPGLTGYSAQNLWYMRQFYLSYKKFPFLQQLVGEIPWGQNIVIMSRVKNEREREFYLRKTLELGWTRNVLIHQVEAEAHKEMEVKKMHNFPHALPVHLAEQADKALKDKYILDFLDVSKPLLERELEKKLLNQLKEFISELGLGFCFIGSQYKLKYEDKEYYIDLLFFHRKLRSLVAVELKIGTFKPEYAGKMSFYLSLLDDLVRLPEENPSIGIIICKDRDRFEVEYALKGISTPVGVSEYQLTKKLPGEFKRKLPTVADLKKGLKKM